MTLTINELGKRTDAVLDPLGEAITLLRGPVWTNGYGVLADPSALRLRIAEASAHLDAALKALRETKWPTNREWDALEGAHNSGDAP